MEIQPRPNSEIVRESDHITSTWEQYDEELKLEIFSEIRTNNTLHKLDHIDFPIQHLDEEYKYYLQESEKIDITQEIVDKATEIISGETDLYTAVFKIADWTRDNIEYDLNSITSKAVLESSWVLENRQGVCDEITSLFISLLRSVGIPARFVSGSAYTNLDYSFGNHGWAEVYFPDYGWVPYDITFGEFGWLNPAHLSLSKTLDSSNSAILYTWLGSNVEIDTSPINIEADVSNMGNAVEKIFDIQIETLVNNVGPGSYVPFRVIIKNPFDKYVTDILSITKSPSELKMNENPSPVLLKPNQEKSSFWIIKLPSDLQQGYAYSSELEVKDIFGSTDSDTIRFGNNNEIITKDEAEKIIYDLETEESLSYSEDLSIECETLKSYYYYFEKLNINCEIKNTGDEDLENLDVCIKNDCKFIDLLKNQEKIVLFENILPEVNTVISITSNEINIYSFINIILLDKPDLRISDFEFENIVNYNDKFDISLILESEAEIFNLELKLGNLKPIKLNKTNNRLPLLLKPAGKNFINEVDVTLYYEDEYGNEFILKESKGIIVEEVPWYSKLFRLFNLRI